MKLASAWLRRLRRDVLWEGQGDAARVDKSDCSQEDALFTEWQSNRRRYAALRFTDSRDENTCAHYRLRQERFGRVGVMKWHI